MRVRLVEGLKGEMVRVANKIFILFYLLFIIYYLFYIIFLF
jgi:hypothetical protein